MRFRSIILAGALALSVAAPATVHAQGVLNGAQNGAEQGSENGGPVGAVVGGTVGAVTGGINGLVGIKERPRFRQYVIEQHRPSFRYEDPVAVGTVLPDDGVQYYQVPAEYGSVPYRYTVVNDEVVLVDPGTRRIVEVVP
jgi:Protein of unknown function (DUF1236)